MLKAPLRVIAAFSMALIGFGGVAYVTWPRQARLPAYTYENARLSEPRSTRCAVRQPRNSPDADRERQACADKAEQYRLQTNDLIQQTRAANAAEAQTNLAAQAAWTAFFQTLGGLLTLAAAIAAAIYARVAAQETRNGAAAARDTLDYTQLVTDLQLRAYLFPSGATVSLNKGVNSSLLYVLIPMQNSGQTPAKLIFHSIYAEYRSPKTVQPIVDHTQSNWRGTQKRTTNVQQLIGPNGQTVIPLYTSMPTAHFDHSGGRVGTTFEQPSTIIRVEVEWWYEDYKGRRYKEIAAFTSPNIRWDTVTELIVPLPQTEARKPHRPTNVEARTQ